jgi:hypothetical protein
MRDGGGRGAYNHTTRESLVLYKSFNTLCLSPGSAIKHPLLVLQYPSISFSHEISPRPENESIVHCQGSLYKYS